jgi:hypothetical protein
MRPARVSTIVWGVLLLLVGGAAFAVTTLDIAVFTASSVAYIVVGLGGLLVVAAIVGAVARSVKPAAPVVEPVETPVAEPVPASSTTGKDQPVD